MGISCSSSAGVASADAKPSSNSNADISNGAVTNAASKGSAGTKVSKATDSRPPSSAPALTPAQKKLIQETWQQLRVDLAGIGFKVFRKVFEIAPEAKQLFGVEDVPADDLARCKKIRSHAIQFMKTVGATVDMLDEDTAVAESLGALGERHVHLLFGFERRFFDAFAEAIVTTFTDELGNIGMSAAASDAWVTMLDVMRTHMTRGYISGKAKK